MDISFEQGTSENIVYKFALSTAIDDVQQKLSMTIPNNIKWIIFDPDYASSQKCTAVIAGLPRKGHDYGYCNPKEKKIWISTLAIKTFNVSQLPRATIAGFKRPDCFLAEVIMDELAHINTKKNHGDPIYEEELKKYYWKYYYA